MPALPSTKASSNRPTVNPYLKKDADGSRRRSFTAAEYVEGIVKGDTSILSQAVTLVESSRYEHQAIGPGGHREVSAPRVRLGAGGYHRRAGRGQEYLDRRLRPPRAQAGRQTGRAGHRPQQRALQGEYPGRQDAHGRSSRPFTPTPSYGLPPRPVRWAA